MPSPSIASSETRAALLFVIVVASALIAADDAHACLCRIGISPLPLPDSTVPQNARLFFTDLGHDLTAELLVDDAGDPVSTSTTAYAWGNAPLVVATPRAPLLAGRTYEAVTTGATFTVSDLLDQAPPRVPSVVDVDAFSTVSLGGSDCGPEDHHARLTLAPDDDARVALIGRDVDDDTFDLVDGVPVIASASADFAISLGRSACGASWPEAAPGASATFVVGTLDIAGNFSGWSEPIDVTLPAVSTVTCTHTSTTTPTPWSALALVLLLVVIRRRRGGQ